MSFNFDALGLGSVADLGKTIVNKIWPDKASEAEKFKAQMTVEKILSERMNLMVGYYQSLVENATKSVVSEATGKSWLQRNWRPIVMLEFAFIIAWNYILAPLLSQPSLEIPPDMWALMKIGLGGYVVGRSAEKILMSRTEVGK